MKPSLSFLMQLLTPEQIDAGMVMLASTAMQSKLAAKRAEGRGGWQEPDAEPGLLMQLLERNLAQGDYVDVMNLAGMLHMRREIYGEEAARFARAETLRPWPAGITPIDSYQKPLGTGGNPSAFVDGDTGLMWGPTLGEYTKADADARVREFRLFDYTDWRLPTRKELFSLVVDGRCNPCCDPAIVDMKSEGYWSASPVPGNEDFFFVVYFHDGGFVYNLRRDDRRWVRPVRSLALPSGQS